MKKWWHYLLLGLLAWLLFMVWRMPATTAYGIAAEGLASEIGEVGLAGVHGTVWSGAAQQLQYRKRVVGAVDWRLSLWGLLLGRVGGDLRLVQGDAYLQSEARAPISGEELALSELEGRLPLPTIQPFLPMIPLPLDGVVSLKLQQLELSSEGRLQRAEGRIVWHQAGVTAPQPLAFGDLQLSLTTAEEGVIEGRISDSGGPMQLNATLTLQADGGYNLKGKVSARESAPKELRSSLALLGRADSQGNYPLNFKGKL